MNIRRLLSQHISDAMVALGLPDKCEPHVVVSKTDAAKKINFGDYQVNGAISAAKLTNAKSKKIAQDIVDQLANNEIFNNLVNEINISGPGFINLTLNPVWLAAEIAAINRDRYLGIRSKNSETIVVDYSAPNLAKEMHVGHLRSTIIGDAIVRILEFQRHKVIRQNHVGDWGTQFGMLIAELEHQLQSGSSASLALKDVEGFYQSSKKHFDESEDFSNKARDYVVKLQSGDSEVRSLWEKFKTISLAHCQDIYERLNVTLKEEHIYGESAYNNDLGALVEELKQQNLAVESQGAQVVFLEGMTDKQGRPSPVVVQKKGGGFLYATADLAAIRYRTEKLKADRILYFIDALQSLHIQQVFSIARKANFVDESVRLEHHAFGTMMGMDGKPFKSRTGDTVKLASLLSEAIERAKKIVVEKNPNLSSEDYVITARKVGIGAVKYADLSKSRTNDYVFDWDTMLSFEGNTAPYLQYAFARIQSIFRRALKKTNTDVSTLRAYISLREKVEIALSIKVLQFSEVIERTTKEAYPHLLCAYLYGLAGLFMRFYEQCPILKNRVETDVRNSRLLLSLAVANTLERGLDLLGIETMDKM